MRKAWREYDRVYEPVDEYGRHPVADIKAAKRKNRNHIRLLNLLGPFLSMHN